MTRGNGITAGAMREWRRGTLLARAVLAHRRAAPRNLTPIGVMRADQYPLWERAYNAEFKRAIYHGRIRPPQGPAGAAAVTHG